jgi:hypothetical protein
VGEHRAAALAALAGAVAATPLRERVAEAVDKVVAGSVGEDHLFALAGARTALLGAVHDALLDRLDAALGRTRLPWQAAPVPAAPSGSGLAACRAWLTEVAVTGWRGVDHDLVSSAGGAVQAALSQPALRRLAVLLDGLTAELRASCPVSRLPRVPLRRWADLWTRTMLLSSAGVPVPEGAAVSGRLLPLGVDVHEHATAVQVQLHGVFEPAGDGPARLVRTGVTVAKVDTICGPALWRLLGGYPILLAAIAEHRAVQLREATLLDSGDLLWREDQARPGEPVDPFATARIQLGNAVAPAVAPLDRHPVRISEPVLVEGDHGLPVALDRLPTCGPLTPAQASTASATIGLLRWDAGRWQLQPIAVQATVKRKTVALHNGAWAAGITDPKVAKADAAAGDAVEVLRERAGRLLRR